MSKRKIEFFKNNYYHIFNRGVDKREIFLDKGDLYYFFDSIQISNNQKKLDSTLRNKSRGEIKKKIINNEKEELVSIIAYCLLPNHFHFILKEKIDGGISKFMSKLGASYALYFNNKYERSGSLFQGRFKATNIKGDFSRELTSAYVNMNYKHHNYNLKKDLVKSSVFEYLGDEKGEFICDKNEIENIIKTIGSVSDYKEYIKGQSKYFTVKHDLDLQIKFDELEK